MVERISENKWIATGGKYRKANEYRYNKIIFEVVGNDLIATFCGQRKKNNIVATLHDFKNKTAVRAIRHHCGPHGWGRHFEEGIMQIYHDLGLPLGYVKSVLRDLI